MESRMMVETSPEGAVASWLRIVSDPVKAGSLHGLLRGFCHDCRNDLNSLKMSLYLARRGADGADPAIWDEFEPRYRAVERLFERLQAIYWPMVPETVRMPLEMLVEERRPRWSEALSRNGRALALDPPGSPTVGDFDPVRLGEGLDAFVSWRAAVGERGRPARLRWGADDGQFHLVWSEPGARALEARDAADDQHEPLALPLLARIVSAHRGAVEVASDDGLQIHLRWPLVGSAS
jgi:hypothetical protein